MKRLKSLGEFLNESQLNEGAKDIARLEKIMRLESETYFAGQTAAQKMAKLIKKPDKAFARYQAAEQLGAGDAIKNIFLKRAGELGHEGAVQILDDIAAQSKAEREAKLKKKQKDTMPRANKLLKALEKKFPYIDFRVSTMGHYPYWNNDGLFLDVGGTGYIQDAPYSGYNSGGPENITNYNKKYLGSDLKKIATVVRRHDLSLFKHYNNFFVFIRFEK